MFKSKPDTEVARSERKLHVHRGRGHVARRRTEPRKARQHPKAS